MANIVWPDNLCPRTFSLQLVADTRTSASVYGGSEIVNDLADDTWAVSMEIDSRSGDTGAALEALVNYLQGGIHTVEFGHFVRPTPRGNLTSLSRASTATYIDAGLLKYAAVDEPRYQDGVLLVEGAATNYALWSTQFENAAWSKTSKPRGTGPITTYDLVWTLDNLVITFE
jgi:hypothetical protein